MPESNDNTIWTDYGYATLSETPPSRKDLHWKTPKGHIYTWDGDGWYRICPPDKVPYQRPKDIPHG